MSWIADWLVLLTTQRTRRGTESDEVGATLLCVHSESTSLLQPHCGADAERRTPTSSCLILFSFSSNASFISSNTLFNPCSRRHNQTPETSSPGSSVGIARVYHRPPTSSTTRARHSQNECTQQRCWHRSANERTHRRCHHPPSRHCHTRYHHIPPSCSQAPACSHPPAPHPQPSDRPLEPFVECQDRTSCRRVL